ncbi:MAG TPA: dihydroxyacetone kinase phosphoryl donor subunit DhaM [Patescibacteria group bacterium]|nr:dihydroxyacetone kinase phosphoryl donor subunit DhaM [Patescibacteria group bacterium]
MVGLVIVSHSGKVAEGIRELAMQMAKPDQLIIAAGGMEDGSIGTDAVRIMDAINQAMSPEGVAVLVDLGSAVLSTETALEMMDEDLRARVKIADAPVLEGAISGAVQASLGSSLEEVLAAAAGARDLHKG